MAEKLNIVGKTFAGYAVEKKVGAGGMGVVYRALDPRLGRTVALKILPPNLVQDENTRQRFLREGRTAAKIDHPNVVRLLAAGEERGYPYLVMEFVDGGSLQQRIDKYHRLPAAEVISISRQVAAALGAAHRAGVLHRDIKPANVLFTREGEAKLADFGLAREENSNVNLSVTGMVMGTPHYMAPEVCEGRKADPRSDLYGLGVMIYTMISGRFPFDGQSVMEVLMAHVQQEAPPLKEAPPALAAVVGALMAKDPGARLQTAEELIAALDDIARNPDQAAPASGMRVLTPPGMATPPSSSRALTPGTSSAAAVTPAVPGTSGAAPQPGVSMVAPLPRTHLIAYSVAGSTIVASVVLLIWAFTLQGPKDGKGGGSAPAGGGTGGGAVAADPELEAQEKELARWKAFAARVQAPGANARDALGELETYRVEEPVKARVREVLHDRLRAELLTAIATRERQLVDLVATDPPGAAREAERRQEWPALPFEPDLRAAEDRAESRVWDAIIEKHRRDAARLEERDEFRLALEGWSRLNCPFQEKRQTVAAEISGVELRARKRAEKAKEAAPSGKSGAKALLDLAAKMPEKIAEELRNYAFLKERAGEVEDPLVQLRGLIQSRDFAGLQRQLEHLEKTGKDVDAGAILAGKRLAASSAQLMEAALAEYRRLAESKEPVEVERADASVESGTVFEVSDAGDQVSLATSRGVVALSPAQLSAWELARRALGPNPPDDRLACGLDFAIITREAELAFACARSFQRRGLQLAAHQSRGVEELILPESREEAETLSDSVLKAREAGGGGDPALGRRLLERFGHLPLGAKVRTAAETLIARGGGAPEARDLKRNFAGEAVLGADGVLALHWAGTDAILEDWLPIGEMQISAGDGITASPKGAFGLLVLENVTFARTRVRLELSCERGTTLSLITAYRTPWDGVPWNFSLETTPSESTVQLPNAEVPVAINSSTDGRHVIELDAGESAGSITVNGVTKKVPLAVGGAGQVALLFTGAVTLRDVRVAGPAAWTTFDLDEAARSLRGEVEAGMGDAVPVGSWRKAGSKETEVAIEAEKEPQMFRPGQWAYGNDYVVSFVARLDGRGTREAVPTVLLDARASSRIFRRFALSGNSRAGFMAREQWMRSGACAEFETGRDHDVRIVVRGDLGMVLLDGRAAWVGTMGPATTGGLALGVRHGKLTVKNLHVRKIER